MSRFNSVIVPQDLNDSNLRRVLQKIIEQSDVTQGNIQTTDINNDIGIVTDDTESSIVGQVSERLVDNSKVIKLDRTVEQSIADSVDAQSVVDVEQQLALTDTSSLVGTSSGRVNSVVTGVAENSVDVNRLQNNVRTLTTLVNDIRKRLTETGI